MPARDQTPATLSQSPKSKQTRQDHGQQAVQATQSPEHYQSTKMKLYNLYYTTSRLNATLHLGHPSDPCLYFMESTLLTIKKPHLLLRSGTSKSSPMVAFARIQLTSRHMLIGSGDYEKDPEDQLKWEELHRVSNVFKYSDYKFTTAIGSATEKRKNYTWMRDKSRAISNVYHCVSEDDELVASMLSGGMLNFNKGAEIEVAEGLEKGLEELLIVSALSIWVWEAPNAFAQGYDSKEKKAVLAKAV